MREAGKSQKTLVKQVLIVMLVVVALVWAAFPFYWALVTSITMRRVSSNLRKSVFATTCSR